MNNMKKIKSEHIAVIISLISLVISGFSSRDVNVIGWLTFLATLIGGCATAGGVWVALRAMSAWKDREDWIKRSEVAENLIEASVDFETSLCTVVHRLSHNDNDINNYRKGLLACHEELLNMNKCYSRIRVASELARRHFPDDAKKISIEVEKIVIYYQEVCEDLLKIAKINEQYNKISKSIKRKKSQNKNTDNIKNATDLLKGLDDLNVTIIKSQKKYTDKVEYIVDLFKGLNVILYNHVRPARKI